jgi:hypothetical protein
MSATDPLFDTERMGLAGLQRTFAAALLQPDGDLPPAISAHSAAQRLKRFNVYRNNVNASLAATLAARFPVVERLVGAEYFRAMALVFIRSNPPSSPVLSEYGEAFPSFLEQFEPAAALVYLPDVARLEWARARAYHAADAEPAAIAALADVAPGQLAGIRFVLHPAASFLASPYPIVSIWATNTHDATVKPIGPDAGGECALVTRPALDVLVTPLPAASSAFLAAVALGEPLGEAAAKAHAAASGFDLSATLVAAFGSGWITKILLPAEPET